MTEKPCGCDTFFCEHYGRHLQWIPVERIGRLALWGFVIVMLLFTLPVLNWAPLWWRLYSACMAQQAEPNTVVQIIQHRNDCWKAANRAIERAR
jgi:hypothetical protein